MEFCTGKSLSEALIFASTNPQYDDSLFIELQFQYIHENSKLKHGEHVVYRNCFWHSEQFLNTTCSPHDLQKERASDKDLPVQIAKLVVDGVGPAGIFLGFFRLYNQGVLVLERESRVWRVRVACGHELKMKWKWIYKMSYNWKLATQKNWCSFRSVHMDLASCCCFFKNVNSVKWISYLWFLKENVYNGQWQQLALS